MKFVEELTIDWYDNILKSFCKTEDNKIYYCCLLAVDQNTNLKVYLAIEIKYLIGHQRLIRIIEENSFKLHWMELVDLVEVQDKNQSYLIKTKNLRQDDVELMIYKKDYKWPKAILMGDYPDILDIAAEIDPTLVNL